DEAMTRSEEQLKVGTTTREAGKARLRKYVVTEEQTVTVPVAREEVRLEREPITDANVGDATAGAEISEEEHEVTLHEEQVVVNKEAVPVERVKLGTETVTEEQQVTEQVRKEQFDTEGLEQTTDSADTSGETTRR
ncbi:MAG: YsnF/AvaK domain-containing protein, partial [Terracoccus sp.]